jgi:hypothetical protein
MFGVLDVFAVDAAFIPEKGFVALSQNRDDLVIFDFPDRVPAFFFIFVFADVVVILTGKRKIFGKRTFDKIPITVLPRRKIIFSGNRAERKISSLQSNRISAFQESEPTINTGTVLDSSYASNRRKE